jgi:hypothetical protein
MTTDDPLLETLRDLRDTRNGADNQIRLLLAYAREAAPRGAYTLHDLADAAGLSVSGVRTAYGPEQLTALRGLLTNTPTPQEGTP